MTNFFQTIMGRDFFQHNVPRIAKSLDAIATEMKRANDLKEQELATPAPDSTDSSENPDMKYYKINCYPDEHTKNFAYFLAINEKLSDIKVIAELRHNHIGNSGLEEHHLIEVQSIERVSRTEFVDGCGADIPGETEGDE